MARILLPLLALLLLSACASQRFEASVTRFHMTPPPTGQSVAVVPLAPDLSDSIEFRVQADAMQRELAAIGFRPAPAEAADLLAVLGVGTQVRDGVPKASPVSVGIGMGGSSGGSGGRVGVGGSVAFPVGGNRSTQILTSEMQLSLRRRVDNEILWEGRAVTTAQGSNPGTNPDLLARALLSGYPGPSGKTVRWVAK